MEALTRIDQLLERVCHLPKGTGVWMLGTPGNTCEGAKPENGPHFYQQRFNRINHGTSTQWARINSPKKEVYLYTLTGKKFQIFLLHVIRKHSRL